MVGNVVKCMRIDKQSGAAMSDPSVCPEPPDTAGPAQGSSHTGIYELSLKMVIFNSGTAPVLGSALHLIMQHGKGETSFVWRDVNVNQLLNYLPYKLLMRHTLSFL